MNVLQNFTPHAHQKRVLASRKRWTIVLAGVRGGKSFSCAAAFVNRILSDVAAGKGHKVPATGSRHRRPVYHAWVCAPSYALLKEPRRYILQLVPPDLIEDTYDATGEIWLKGGILIEFKSTEDPKHLVSVGLNAMWCDEADRIGADAWRGQLMTRLSDHQGWCLFSSTPYAARAGYLWLDFIQRKDEPDADIEFISWKFIDNPTNKLDELKQAKRVLPERYFKREYEASLDAFVGLVFSLQDEKHLFDYVKPKNGSIFRRVIAGVDWGWNDPGAIIVVGDTGKQLYVIAEHCESHVPVIAGPGERSWLTIAYDLRTQYNIDSFYCDPSSPAYIHAFQSAGFSALSAYNDIKVGVRRIDEQLMPQTDKRPGLLIDKSCKSLIKEMKNLAWATDKKSGAPLEEPAPGNDHCIDAMRYAVMELRRYPDTNIQPITRRVSNRR